MLLLRLWIALVVVVWGWVLWFAVVTWVVVGLVCVDVVGLVVVLLGSCGMCWVCVGVVAA